MENRKAETRAAGWAWYTDQCRAEKKMDVNSVPAVLLLNILMVVGRIVALAIISSVREAATANIRATVKGSSR